MTPTQLTMSSEATVIYTSRPLVLASASPRRAELLKRVGLEFAVVPSEVDESLVSGAAPRETALALALAKARSVSSRLAESAVLAADTVVALDGEELGKPIDRADAISMLRMLNGRSHTVYTGVAVAMQGDVRSSVAETHVKFRRLSVDEIERYVDSGSPMDKAGAYGIQDSDFSPVESFDGSYTNVVGLPMAVTGSLLIAAGVIDSSDIGRFESEDR